MIAQMFPGMEWIPVMFISIVVGLAAGLVAILIAAINRKSIIVRWFGALACFIGVATPVLLAISVGGSLTPSGYICVGVPVIPGLIALSLFSCKTISTKKDSPENESTSGKEDATSGKEHASGKEDAAR